MKHQSGWFNKKLLTDDDIEDVQYALVAKSQKPIGIALHNRPLQEEESHIMADNNLSLARLFVKFSMLQQNDLNTMLHDIELHSPDCQRLYQWNIFQNVLEPFVWALHHQIRLNLRTGRRTKLPNAVPIDQEANVNALLYQTQDRLADSYFDARDADTRFTINALEQCLGAILLRVSLQGDVLLLFFDFPDSVEFLFIMGFRLHFKRAELMRAFYQKQTQPLAIVSLQRPDVMEYDEVETEAAMNPTADGGGPSLHQMVKKHLQNSTLSYLNSVYTKKK